MVDYRKFLVVSCILLQILDGGFTAFGALNSGLGVEVEGNPIIKSLMENIGIVPAITLVKVVGISLLIGLNKNKAPTYFFGIIFGIYAPVVSLWAYLVFLDKLP